ncbi:hypothetical protein RB195_018843 [Necator americanus]|uniref:Tetraspanin family protein n=1 Tax=Necator americanus TaxID=51031 RepID=A0ABR1CBF4_NECAM
MKLLQIIPLYVNHSHSGGAMLGCCGVQSSNDWKFTDTQLKLYSCFRSNYNVGCEKQIHSRISTDSQYLGAASMGVVLVEIIASFLAGYRAYNFAHPDDDQ